MLYIISVRCICILIQSICLINGGVADGEEGVLSIYVHHVDVEDFVEDVVADVVEEELGHSKVEEVHFDEHYYCCAVEYFVLQYLERFDLLDDEVV